MLRHRHGRLHTASPMEVNHDVCELNDARRKRDLLTDKMIRSTSSVPPLEQLDQRIAHFGPNPTRSAKSLVTTQCSTVDPLSLEVSPVPSEASDGLTIAALSARNATAPPSMGSIS